jgi:protein-disulfide isomerase
MSKAIAVGIVGLSLSVAMLGFGYFAGSRTSMAATEVPPASAPSVAAMDRSQVEAIVREYLIGNPEIMIEVQQALDERQREAERVARLDTIATASDHIFNAAYDGIVGNPEGSVTIVEFFDYNCGFCKRGVEDMDALVAADPDLRFVLKEFPILGPDSRAAHIVSMAFRSLAPDQYGEFHRDLMLGGGRATEASAIAAAVRHGVDEAALREEMQNPEITAAFERTFMLADSLSITGTPSYVVGSEVVFGALGQEVLAEKVAAARACPDGNC